MNEREYDKSTFPSVEEELKSIGITPDTPQTRSQTYRLAFTDDTFMLSNEARSMRLQLEFLKPELTLQKANIDATIVVFGSARIPEPDVALAEWERAKQALSSEPNNDQLKKQTAIAKKIHEKSKYYTEARKLARLISNKTCQPSLGNTLIMTGGGPGIMEATNRGAHDTNKPSIGLNISLPHEQKPNAYISPEFCFQFHYFALRKMHFLLRAKALIAFPGGYGTLDELFNTLTLIQTGKAQLVPIILVGRSYWKQVISFEAMVDEGMISEAEAKLVFYAETAEEVWELIREFYRLNHSNGQTDT